jgi:hypothetical protein
MNATKRMSQLLLPAFIIELAVVAVYAWANWPHRDNTLPLEEVVDRSELTSPGGVNLVLLSRQMRTYDDGRSEYVATFALANDSDHAIGYFGIPPVHEEGRLRNGYINPYRNSEAPGPSGGWGGNDFYRCASGCRELIIQPGQAARFEEHQSTEYPVFRVKLNYGDAGDRLSDMTSTIFSEPIDARGGESVRASDATPIFRKSIYRSIVEMIDRIY